jgi:hypothetical protein
LHLISCEFVQQTEFREILDAPAPAMLTTAWAEGEKMVVVPLSMPVNDFEGTPGAVESEKMNWVGFAAGGTLVAGGLLLLAGERRAGMVAAATGTALAMVDQKDTLHSWWNCLPAYIDQVQKILGQVQDTVNDIAVKREALRRALAR